MSNNAADVIFLIGAGFSGNRWQVLTLDNASPSITRIGLDDERN